MEDLSVPPFGIAVLGNFKYVDDLKSPFLELGHALANLEYLSRHCGEGMMEQADIPDVIKSINKWITENALSYQIPDEATERVIKDILVNVKGLYQAHAYVLCLISICSWYLKKQQTLNSKLSQACEPSGRGTLEIVAREHIDEIGLTCKEMSVNIDLLWDYLNRKVRTCSKPLSQAVRELLLELSEPLKILMISADPKNVRRLQLDEERRELEHVISRTKFRDTFSITNEPRCRTGDIMRALNAHKPDILHFSGHGKEEGLCFEDDRGDPQLVRHDDIANLLGLYSEIKLVILNACYSESQARSVVEKVQYLIGMAGAIRDKDAIIFTEQFYSALGSCNTVEESFERAGAAVRLDMSAKFHAILYQKGRSDPISIVTPQEIRWGRRSLFTRGLEPGQPGYWPLALAVLLSVFAMIFSVFPGFEVVKKAGGTQLLALLGVSDKMNVTARALQMPIA